MAGKTTLADLTHIDPSKLQPVKPIIFPDLSISATAKDCTSVAFTVNYSPGSFKPSANPGVKVRVIDKIRGTPTTVGEVLLFVPAGGGSTTATIEWPRPPDSAEFSPYEITVVADPDNTLFEFNKLNNSVTLTGWC